MEKQDLYHYLKNKFKGIKSRMLDDGEEQLIVPKGLMPLVDGEIKGKGYLTIDQSDWKEDDCYLVIKIIK